MPEGVSGYPRWQGSLAGTPPFLVIAGEDIRRALRNVWGQAAFGLAFGLALVNLLQTASLANARGDAAAHTWANFILVLGYLQWAALGVAAVMAGPALLEDSRRGALELYLSRGISRRQYVAGKVLAVFGLTFLAFAGAALMRVGLSYVFFDVHPTNWHLAFLGSIAHGLLIAYLAAGLGLGLSCLARSSRGATLMLFGGIAVMDIVVSSLLEGVTGDSTLKVLSPLAALGQQSEWMYGQPGPFAFPAWWGLVEILVLGAIGWALVVWKQPRMAGEV